LFIFLFLLYVYLPSILAFFLSLSFSPLTPIFLLFLLSDEVREIIKKNSNIILSLLYRLSRCLMDNQHFPSSALLTDKDKSSTSSSSASAAVPQHLKMIDFPYSSENFTLFQTICRLLYQFDIFSMIEPGNVNTNEEGVAATNAVAGNKGSSSLAAPSTSLAHAVVPVDHDLVNYFLTENIQNPNFTKKIAEIENIDDIHLHLMKARSHPSSLRSVATNNSPNPNGNGNPPSFHVALASNSNHHTPRAVAGNVSPVYYVSPKELLNFIIVIILTTGPYDWSLYITANNDLSSVFYTGNLIHCEECILQLLMLSSEKNIAYLFSLLPSAVSVSASASSLAPASPATLFPSYSSNHNHNQSDSDIPINRLSISTSGASHVSLCQDMIDIIISHRRLFLANSLIRILTTIIQRIKNGSFDLNERAAMICPILVRTAVAVSAFLIAYCLSPSFFFLLASFFSLAPFI
jgi:hypothetical protein